MSPVTTGHRPITKLLIANRGEIAARVIRSAHDLGISTVAVYSDPDFAAPYVGLADEAVRLPGASPAETYLRADLILAAAASCGADAVHPGYGFLSENADFARACAEAGLVFVGPSPAAIAAMGSKIEAKARMADAGVPVLPGATVEDDSDLAALGDEVGFPLLVKASYGGGGRGMRVVHRASELAEAVTSARREAESAFGNSIVFLERYLVDPRHVEVQILGDSHGNVVHLFERECSIQRRHQKILEEAPSPAVDPELRSGLGAAAVAAGKAIDYVGAGTVEFVLADDGFAFLEVNTRLQVEHPVTELITGLDLVALQLRIAEGEPLPAEVLEARVVGHAIEARLYAEDVPAGFLPATGVLHRFRVPAGAGVRIDAGVADGSVVGTHYDPMLAKVIAHGPTRTVAARRLARALAHSALHGVTTNRDLLVGILGEAEFLAGDTDTGYLTRHDPTLLGSARGGTVREQAVVAALSRQAENRSGAVVLASAPSGWRNVSAARQQVSYALGDEVYDVAYRLGRAGLVASVNGDDLTGLRIVEATVEHVTLDVDGTRRTHTVHRAGGVTYVDGPTGSSALSEIPRFRDPAAAVHAGSLLAPMPGAVVRTMVEVGEPVRAGQALIVLEAMKMEHTVSAPVDGVLTELQVSAGDQVDTGQVLAVVAGDGESP